MRFQHITRGALALAALASTALASHANEPIDGKLGMQPAASEMATMVSDFHTLVLWIITIITLFVTVLLAWVIIRYRAKANPTPSSFSHNTALEVAWTTVPVLVLIAIAFFSFPLLFASDVEPTKTRTADGQVRELTADDWITIKTYGHQWYWRYIYDAESEEPLEFESRLLQGEDLAAAPGARRQLSVDYPTVVPLGKHVRLNIGAYDVIHAWTIPAFRMKVDAIPGRLNQLWFKAEKEGVYYGQCSELCGLDHAYMPIELRIVSQPVYDQWKTLMLDDPDAAVAYLNTQQPRPAQPVAVASAE